MLSGTSLQHWQRCLLLLSLPVFAHASEIESLTKNPKNWAMQAGDMANRRYSELKEINKDNAKNLQVAWTFSTGVLRGHEGGPLVIGDTMYVHSPFPNQVYALNLEDQSIRWKYEPKQDPSVIAVMCCDTVSRGVAYSDGKVFLQQADTTLVALDAKTGKELWKYQTGSGVVSVPVTWEQDGEQYIGLSSGYGGAVPLWGGDMAELTKQVTQGGSYWVFKLPKAPSRVASKVASK